jgi:hypothetical protein
MSDDGRIAVFDGQSDVQWIADGLWLFLQNDIDSSYAYKIFGVYDHRLHCVIFYYPRNGDNGLLKGMVIINLPLQGSGIDKYSAFLGISSIPVTYGCRKRFENQINRSVIFSSSVSDQQSFQLDELSQYDDETVFNCSFQTSLLPLPDLRHYHINVESFLQRGTSYGGVTLKLVSSNALESLGGTINPNPAHMIDLAVIPIQEYYGFNIPTRWVGLNYSWLSTSTVRYGGAVMYGVPLS